MRHKGFLYSENLRSSHFTSLLNRNRKSVSSENPDRHLDHTEIYQLLQIKGSEDPDLKLFNEL